MEEVKWQCIVTRNIWTNLTTKPSTKSLRQEHLLPTAAFIAVRDAVKTKSPRMGTHSHRKITISTQRSMGPSDGSWLWPPTNDQSNLQP